MNNYFYRANWNTILNHQLDFHKPEHNIEPSFTLDKQEHNIEQPFTLDKQEHNIEQLFLQGKQEHNIEPPVRPPQTGTQY